MRKKDAEKAALVLPTYAYRKLGLERSKKFSFGIKRDNLKLQGHLIVVQHGADIECYQSLGAAKAHIDRIAEGE